MGSLLHQLFPQGIESTFQRQLKRLPQSMHPLLTAAAVAGTEIDNALLDYLISQHGYSFRLEDWLVHAVSAAILKIEEGHGRFADEALRFMLLQGLSESEKINWHEEIANALESLYQDSPAHAANLAYHWQQIGNAPKERQYAHQAGAYAHQNFDHDTAVIHFSRALDLTPEENLPGQYEVLLAREQVFHVQGNRDAQKDDLTRLAELADALSTESDQTWRAEVALRLGTFAEVTGEYTVAIVAATEALRLAEAGQAPAHEAASHLLWGQALLRQGKYEEAQEKLKMSQSQAQAQQLSQVEAHSLRALGICANDLGQFEQAKNYYEAALPLYQALDNKRGESTVLNNLSIVAYSQKRWVAAMAHWEDARLIHEAIGDKEGTARVLTNLSSVCLDLGEYDKGLAFSEDALKICRETDLRFGQGMNLINLSLFSNHLQAFPQAEIYSRAALEMAREMKSLPLEGLALKDRAYILLQQEQWAEAEQAYQQALAIWQELGQSLQILEVQAGLARVALHQENLAQAQAHLAPVISYLQAGNTPTGTSRPFYIYLVCYEVLAAGDDPYSVTLLQQAHEELAFFAENITEPSQQRAFFENVPEHQQIRSLFMQLDQSG